MLEIYVSFCIGRNLESCPLQDGGAEYVSFLLWREGGERGRSRDIVRLAPPLTAQRESGSSVWLVAGVPGVWTSSGWSDSVVFILFYFFNHKVLLVHLNIRGLIIVCGQLIILKKINMNLGICVSLVLLLCGLSLTWAQTNASKMIHISVSFFLVFIIWYRSF